MSSMTKIIATGLGGLVIVLLFVLIIVRPNLREVGNLNFQASEAETKLQTLLAQIEAYKNSQADLNSIHSKDRILDSFLVSENLQVAIVELETAAAKTNVEEGLQIQETITNKNSKQAPTPVVAGKIGIDEVAYNVAVHGAYKSVVLFMQYLEHLPHFTEMSSINLSAVTSDTTALGVTKHSDNVNANFGSVFLVKKK